MNNGPEDKDKDKKSGKEGHHRKHHSHHSEDGKKEKKAKKEGRHSSHHSEDGKAAKKHHHKERTTSTAKPTGHAPVPPLEERIVADMHTAAVPTTTAPKALKTVEAPKSIPSAQQPDMPKQSDDLKQPATVELGFFAKAIAWIKNTLLKPAFSRQQQVSNAYSMQFLTTLNAVQKRFSANDETPDNKLVAHKSLQFSGKTEKSSAVDAAAALDHSVSTKPTIH